MSNLYALIDVQEKQSRINPGALVYQLKWIDLDTLAIYTTAVDTSYRNYTRSHWDQYIRDPITWGIYSGLKRSARQDQHGGIVISADSHPHCEYIFLTQNQSIEFVEELVNHRYPDPLRQFNHLFG